MFYDFLSFVSIYIVHYLLSLIHYVNFGCKTNFESIPNYIIGYI